MYRKYSMENGFTLVELLYAAAIIGILMAIAIPIYNGYIDQSKNKNAIADIYMIQSTIERFYTEFFRYPATLADISAGLPNGGLDPWGNPYVYLNIIDGGPGIRGKVRKDKSTNPINSLYDLYSKGKDGATKIQLDNKLSVDDIVLGRDGGFVGLASEF